MDKEAREKIAQEIKRRTDPYRYDDGKLHYYSLADQIIKIMDELGYRKLPTEPPPVLSDEEITNLWKMLCNQYPRLDAVTGIRKGAQAQRDADRKYYNV